MIANLAISPNWAKKKESKKNHSYMVGNLFEECMGIWLPINHTCTCLVEKEVEPHNFIWLSKL